MGEKMKALNHDGILLISPREASKKVVCSVAGSDWESWWKDLRLPRRASAKKWNIDGRSSGESSENPDSGVTAFPAGFSDKMRGRLESQRTQRNSVRGGRLVSRKIRKGCQTDSARRRGCLIRPTGLLAAFDLRRKFVGQKNHRFSRLANHEQAVRSNSKAIIESR